MKPEKSDTPESGFQHPENEISQTALEVYDGFLEYMNSFLINHVDSSIVDECKLRKNQMLEDLKELNEYI